MVLNGWIVNGGLISATGGTYDDGSGNTGPCPSTLSLVCSTSWTLAGSLTINGDTVGGGSSAVPQPDTVSVAAACLTTNSAVPTRGWNGLIIGTVGTPNHGAWSVPNGCGESWTVRMNGGTFSASFANYGWTVLLSGTAVMAITGDGSWSVPSYVSLTTSDTASFVYNGPVGVNWTTTRNDASTITINGACGTGWTINGGITVYGSIGGGWTHNSGNSLISARIADGAGINIVGGTVRNGTMYYAAGNALAVEVKAGRTCTTGAGPVVGTMQPTAPAGVMRLTGGLPL